MVVETSLSLEQLKQDVSESNEKIEELKGKLEQVERDKNELNAENEELAKRM